MNDLQLFSFKGNDVRIIDIAGEPYFVGNDISQILGYSNYRKATAEHVEADDKLRTQIRDAGQLREVTVINESGLYSLILGSKLPQAREFKRWVTHEVLPTIRQTGAYVTAKTAEDWLSNPDMMIATLERYKEAQVKIQQLHDENQQLKPKALFADAVATSNTSILVGDLAKILKQNGVETGARRLFNWLRDQHYLISRKGADYNSPTQRSMELGLFEIKESTHINGDGVTVTTKTPKVTGKGQTYFINKFLKTI